MQEFFPREQRPARVFVAVPAVQLHFPPRRIHRQGAVVARLQICKRAHTPGVPKGVSYDAGNDISRLK